MANPSRLCALICFFAVASLSFAAIACEDAPFTTYSVPAIYTGAVARPQLDHAGDRMFHSRIWMALKQPVNFAGEYVLTSWGCGTLCVGGAVVSRKTGRVVFIPHPLHVGKEDTPLCFRPDSRLLIMTGAAKEGGETMLDAYALNGGRFVQLLVKSSERAVLRQQCNLRGL